MLSAANVVTADPFDCQALKDLSAQLDEGGFFTPSHFWRWKLMLWVPLFFLFYGALVILPWGPLWLLLVPVASVGLLTMGYVGHDAGQYALSKKRWVNDFWGQYGMPFLCGMSFAFWLSLH